MAKAALEERIRSDLQHAVRQGDTNTVNILSLLVTSLDNASIAQDRKELSAVQVEEQVSKMSKRVQESIAIYDKAGRKDLLAEEQSQFAILEQYLPKPLSESEVRDLIAATIKKLGVSGPQAMGQVMAAVRPEIGTRADGTLVATIVREQLA